jgi:adenylate cyclase
MSQKRAKFLETRIFGFVIAAAVALVILGLSYGTGLFQSLETKVLDTHFALKMSTSGKTLQEGSVYAEKNIRISDDIMIVGVDFNTLSKYGKWPFPRERHASLVDSFAKIKDQGQRESSLFLDIFFTEEDPNKASDDALVRSMKDSGRVYLETILARGENDSAFASEMEGRELALYSRLGTIRNVKGPWKEMEGYLSSEPPLPAYTEAIKGYGQANYNYDKDHIYRSQPLVAKSSHLVAELDFAELKPGFKVDESKFERLAWLDKSGSYHNIDTPLTASGLSALGATLEKEAPAKIEDLNGDGQPDSQRYIIRKFQDYFVPAITLSLALDYFGKSLDDVEVVLGEKIRIPSPTRYDPDTGTRLPYEIQVTPDEFDANGNLVKAGTKRAVPQIDIPIDANGLMLINYMGYPSSDTSDGPQTFPVRSYSGYADKAPKPDQDPATWRRSLAAGNKIVMVGAFAKGMAADEKPTPYGLMYGIEVHANALNTIIMDNFIHRAPEWLELAILGLAVLIIAFLTSRLSTIISFFGTLILVTGYFFGVSVIFEQKAFLLNFTTPAIAMVFTFISIVVYRAMTEQRDKERIRETFGKYLSPKVVDQLVDDPPELGGVDKELSVLFSDIRSFTTLSESMTPQELVNHLNTYLTAMTDVILEDGGYLDKYVGDEVMCFWGAPLPQADHALRACRCALRQMAKLRELNAGWPEAIRINIGIGVNSGIMTVGNMGSPAKMNYTLMGDNVNLGARLEGTNKEYGTNIIISEYTYGLVKDKIIVRELDNIRVKGKNKPVVIYELIDMAEGYEAQPEPTSGKGKK